MKPFEFFTTLQPTNDENVSSLWSSFQDYSNDPQYRSTLLQALHEQFYLDDVLQKMNQYYDTYWAWYVILLWDHLEKVPQEEVVKMIPYTIITAIRLEKDVATKILDYFLWRVDEENRQSVFISLRDAWKNTNYPLRFDADKSMQFKDIYDTYKAAKRSETLGTAEFYAMLQQELFPEGDPLVFESLGDKSEAVTSFVQLVEFVHSQEDINKAVQNYYRLVTEPYEELEVDEDGMKDEIANMLFEKLEEKYIEEATKKVFGNDAEESNIDNERDQNVSTDALQKEIDKANVSEDTESANIKSLIDSQFKKDETGQYEDLAGVMAKLQELAEERNNPKIEEAYIFNEETGKFEWDERFIEEDKNNEE